MKKTKNNLDIEEITKKELSAVESSDKISKLEKEKNRDKKIIAEYKEREKASARALVLYERKIKYLKETVIEDVLALCKKIDNSKEAYLKICEKIVSQSLRDEFAEYKNELILFTDELYEMCNKVEANAQITKQDRDFISNRKTQEQPKTVDVQSRFDRLKNEFNQKIGGSVNRRPGRPKKSEQSIVADIGLRKKVEKTVAENDEIESKLNDIFYATPENKKVVSNIPKTESSVFDFNEALNPNISLQDIMSDLMSDREDEEIKTYGNNDAMKEIQTAQKKQKIELLESGFMRSPVFGEKQQVVENKTIDPLQKKPTFEKRFLSIQNIFKDSN